MKAISVKQPYSGLIVYGIKDIENRTWPCPKAYIGQRVLIHASAIPVKMINPNSVFTKEQWDSLSTELQREVICGKAYINSAIIGSVEIVDCVVNHPSIWAEKTDNYTIGMNHRIHEDITGKKVIYNWVLSKPVLYENPLYNIKGKLSFWDYPGIREVVIECPECGSHEFAVEDHTTVPFSTYIHLCNKCGYVIMESEWEVVST
ncbi:ASCH domain-containing protein [Bacteroides caccae]|uniref:ASCH domain-containing protein n=1 Tax=Bacteroides caccae TaxID=47678 RepID=UPI0021662A0C|nr:ASCH domain-containing protein [Bacteroides caccae]MCS2366427.1 ASCH domain-containing protein [Bacteroides caccae]MCS3190865.1 ASCH domain-containing protein [Bacteroides caccae]